jgi:flagellar motility protein MotE (MotC chaperone)
MPMTSLQFLLHMSRLLLALGCVSASVAGVCAEQKKSDGAGPVESGPSASDIKQFCANNATIAGDARIAWQTSKLRELETQITQRIAELDSKKAQLAEWIRKRDEAMKRPTTQ